MNAFEGLRISEDWRKLFDINERQPCRKCFKSRKYFCYTCYTLNADLENNIPQIKCLVRKISRYLLRGRKHVHNNLRSSRFILRNLQTLENRNLHDSLPFKIDIVKHSREIAGKSTAIHARLLAPNDVTIYTYPDLPKYTKNDKVILIYPGKSAVALKDLFSSEKQGNNGTKVHSTCITHAVFIDSTWNQSNGILKDPILSAIPCIKLQLRLSQFWRHHKGSPRWFLSTIEAIHQLLVEYTDINGFMYEKIHILYEHDELKAYRRPVNI